MHVCRNQSRGSLRKITSLVVLAAITFVAAERPALVAHADEPEVDYETDVVYGKGGDEELKLDIATPKGLDHPVPAIVLIHGGGWRAGNRQDMKGLTKQAAEHGYVAATISYRFAPKYLFPAQVEDAKCAVRYLRSVASERHIDPDKIGAVGMSAGAHLAMMLGTMDTSDGLEGDGGHADQPSKVQSVVSFVGPCNLVGEFPEMSTQILAGFVGGRPSEKVDVCKQASPITYVNKGDAPMLLFFGTRDPLIPTDQAYQMTSALTNAGIPARVELIVGAGHGWAGKEMEHSVADMWEHFDRSLKGAAAKK
ncbi:MAG TPA: alpha/beta hydrolase [Pirellulales bacterium]|nr:alpha/beta hydrolase [Pirellulales bacterium]